SITRDGFSKSVAMQVAHAARVACGGKDPFDNIIDLAEAECSRGTHSSYFFIVKKKNRRDANYGIQDTSVTHIIRSLQSLGMEIGVHGSYNSFDLPGTIAHEFGMLQTLGFNPVGHRAHWLRFTIDRLITGLEAATPSYDSSLGWAKSVGFRAGACF